MPNKPDLVSTKLLERARTYRLQGNPRARTRTGPFRALLFSRCAADHSWADRPAGVRPAAGSPTTPAMPATTPA